MKIDGTDLFDILFGSNGPDTLFGFGGNDQLYGRAGPDILLGGKGNDLLDGGADFSPHPTLTEKGFNDELYGDDGQDVLHVAGRFGYSNGDGDNDGLAGNDQKFGDLTIIHRGDTSGRATLVNQFDVRGHGGGNAVQDHFKMASSDDFDFAGMVIRPGSVRQDADGVGWSARLQSVTISGEFGELVKFQVEGRFGFPAIHSDDGSHAEAVADVMHLVEVWAL